MFGIAIRPRLEVRIVRIKPFQQYHANMLSYGLTQVSTDMDGIDPVQTQ